MSRLAEVDIIVSDLERANSRVAEVERRNVSFTISYLLIRHLIVRLENRKSFVRRSKQSEAVARVLNSTS
jgi:hypothetical protein